MKLCFNIVNAHRTKAFGRKPGLWDFFKDVASKNNKDVSRHQGFRYSKNTLVFAQTMKVYGGCRMVDFFSWNFARPTYARESEGSTIYR